MAKNTSQFPDAGSLTGAEFIPIWQDGVQKKVTRDIFIAGLGGGGGSLPIATGSVLGGVKVGSGLAIDGAGVLSVSYTYTLPAASAGTRGGIRVGSGLSIDGSGILSATGGYTLPVASASVLGGVKVGTGLTIDGAGVLASAVPEGPAGKSAYEIAVEEAGFVGTELEWLDSLRAGDATIGGWNPSMLTVPPKTWFDADQAFNLIDFASPATTVMTKLRSLYGGAGVYEMVPNNTVVAQHRNPNFGMRRSVYMSGGANVCMTLQGTGALTLLRNKPGCTYIFLGRFLTELPAGGEGYVISASCVTSPVARANLGKSTSQGNGFRYGGRRLDGNSFDGADIGGNRGTTPVLVICEFDWANARKRFRCNGTLEDTDTSFQTAGNSDDTDSAFIGIAAFQTSSGFPTQFEFQIVAIHDGIYSTADLEKLEGYLMHRARLSSLLPAAHPYKSAPPSPV